MQILGLIFILAGAIVACVYGIIILIKAFKTSVLWGLGSLFVPFVGLIFVIMNWEECKKPFLMSLLCIPLYLLGFFLSSMGAGY